MRIIVLILTLVLSHVALGHSAKLVQKRYELSYQEIGRGQVIRLKGSVIIESGESQDTLLNFLRKEVRSGMELRLVLDMFGGDLAVVNKVYDVLKAKQSKITTEVEMFRYCASACIPLFMVGNIRVAAERSNWGFHQASTPVLPIMIPFMSEYVLRQKGVNKAWLKKNKAMFHTLKITWLSPVQLNGSGIVTKIIAHPK